jgi:hypothetical protein
MTDWLQATIVSGIAALAAAPPWVGRAAFVGVFVLLLIWLVALPSRLVPPPDPSVPWWQRVRFWAIVITLAQILVYSYWG